MQLVIITDCRYMISPSGKVYAESSINYDFLKRYLDVFEKVRVVARMKLVDTSPSEERRADGPNIEFWEVPYFCGARDILLLPSLVRSLFRSQIGADAFILRIPGIMATFMWLVLLIKCKSYGIEVISDPYDVFSSNTLVDKIRRYIFSTTLRMQCRRARAAAYVTERIIQERYPPRTNIYQTYYSSINLADKNVTTDLTARNKRLNNITKRLLLQEKCPIILGYGGTFNHMYKAPDIHIKAIYECTKRGYNIYLRMLGDGMYRQDMESLAKEFEIDSRITFLGQVSPGESVLSFLDNIDIFLCASRGEGLPRILIEAMARGCPAIGTNVSGIPELLTSDALVAPNDHMALADKICETVETPDILNLWSSRNWIKAQEYTNKNLQPRRISLYQRVLEKPFR